MFIGAKGVLGYGFSKAFVSFLAAYVAASAEDVDITEKGCRENYTVSAILSPRVFGMYNLCQR